VHNSNYTKEAMEPQSC